MSNLARREATLYGRDWRAVVAAWDDARRARHQAETAELVAAGWNVEAAEYVAYELITKEASS